MKTKTNALVGIALAIASTLAFGGPADPGATAMLQKLKGLYPATRFTSVTGTPIDGVYEVVMGQNVAYVGGDGRHFLFGHLFDMRTQQDLTAAKFTQSEETPGEARQVNFATLPLQDAVKVVKGDGSRLLAVFSDPRCPYCKALDEELARFLKDGPTAEELARVRAQHRAHCDGRLRQAGGRAAGPVWRKPRGWSCMPKAQTSPAGWVRRLK